MYSPTMKERFQRVLGLPQRGSPTSTGLKKGLLVGLLALIGLLGAPSHVPWVVDTGTPTASWVQLIVGLSLLNTAMTWWHSFRLWRIYTHRGRARCRACLAPGQRGETRDARERAAPHPEGRAQLDASIDQLTTMSDRCHRGAVRKVSHFSGVSGWLT